MCSTLFVVTLLVSSLSQLQAFGSAMPPCIHATLSANGSILVQNDLALGMLVNGSSATLGSKFTLYKRYSELKQGTRFRGPGMSFQTTPVWSINLLPADGIFVGCPSVLVTDDAEFLVLIDNDLGGRGTALRIYERQAHPGQPYHGPWPAPGVLVRNVQVPELLPASADDPIFFTDHTPQWYSGATFAFSADNRVLNVTTRKGAKHAIDLATGAVAAAP